MYNKFKNCLLKPSKIFKYIDEKFWKSLVYFLLLALIYVLPNIVSITRFSGVDKYTLNKIVTGFAKSEDIDYQLIKENDHITLVPKKNEYKPQCVHLESIYRGLDIVLLFNMQNVSINNYQIPNDLVGKVALYLEFSEEEISFYTAVYKGVQFDNDGGIQKLSKRSNNSFYTTKYDNIGFGEMDFTITRGNMNLFSNKINDFIMTVYNNNKVAIFCGYLPTIYISGIIRFLLDALLLAFLVKIMYFKYGLKFNKIFKIVILTYTPRVIFNILSIFWASLMMYIIGEIISVIYLLIAINSYSIQQIIDKNRKQM